MGGEGESSNGKVGSTGSFSHEAFDHRESNEARPVAATVTKPVLHSGVSSGGQRSPCENDFGLLENLKAQQVKRRPDDLL